jgi:hypothetical protein
MRRAMVFLTLNLAVGGCFSARAQGQPPPHSASRPNAERLGLTCAQILKMTSMDWIENYRQKTQGGPLDLESPRAIAAYGECYDSRTDALAASMARTGKGPTKAARAEFAAFEADLRDFESKALSDTKAADDSQRKSYADLYEKQFRYEFYEEYESRQARSAQPPAASGVKPPAPATKSAATAARAPGAPSAGANTAPHEPANAEERARSDADPVTQEKNRFGKILEALPEDQMHDVHRVFSEVIGPHSISEPMRLEVYRYAIYILQPQGSSPFEPPPF